MIAAYNYFPTSGNGRGGSIQNIQTSASSTTFVFANTSTRILATSTRRVAAIIQPSCAANTVLTMNDNNDIAATSFIGLLVTSSSTFAFGEAVGASVSPIPNGSVQAITNGSSCTVNVTEYRANF